MTEKEYRQHEGISRSQLWKIRESPEKFMYAMEHPEEPTPALLFGQMVHKLILEPDDFQSDFVVMPEIDKRTKEGKALWSEFLTAAGDCQIVKQTDYDKALAMRDALFANQLCQILFSGDHEVPVFWTDPMTGEPCKVRLDCAHELSERLLIVEYKSTTDASTEAFLRQAINLGYDFQAAMYREGVKQTRGCNVEFVFVPQEKDPPYAANILRADDLFIDHGFDTFRELLGIYHACKTSGNWFGYLGPDNMLNTLGLPAWLAKDIEQ